ncbi:MAG TPA: lysophospholipid acyltransferase family protein [Chitinophagaceae bacterium]|nr:lysophospholipid acyltransferase family protein [Chitinophagaceae bacterium]
MYYLVFAIFYLLSLLPLTALYLLSDGCYFITYYLLGYRKEVVFKNISIAFPEKSKEEQRMIAKQFYHHFWDNWIESLKLMSISGKALRRRVSGDMKALQNLHAAGRNFYILLGHQFNWEWANAFVAMDGVQVLCAYAPLSNKIIDRLLLHIRTRFGAVLLPFNDMRRGMLPYRNQQWMLALMADQSPPIPEKSYWLNFFGRPTAFLKGPDRGARLGNLPVVYVALRKPARGKYDLQARLLTNGAGQLQEGALAQLYAAALEESILQQPSLYLWSHNRWKHHWKEAYANGTITGQVD